MTNPIGNMCQRCTKICPFNRPNNRPEDFRNWDGDLRYIYESVERQARRLRDNNYIEPSEHQNKWWLPLEYKDGVLTEAPEYDYDSHTARMKQTGGRRSDAQDRD